MIEITATEASRKFSDVLDKVASEKEEFEVLRGGIAVARIVPSAPPKKGSLEDFVALLGTRRLIPDPTFERDMAEAKELVDSAATGLGDPWAR